MTVDVFEAMEFFRQAHIDQVRKYTGNPYADHLAEVTGIALSVGWHDAAVHPNVMMAVAWGHDSIEDQGLSRDDIAAKFGEQVADGIVWLSDVETGNRETRKRLSRERLAKAPGWVQTIKCADLISNTSSIVKHDPNFAKTYLVEKRLLLSVLTKADERLRGMANSICHGHIYTLFNEAQAA